MEYHILETDNLVQTPHDQTTSKKSISERVHDLNDLITETCIYKVHDGLRKSNPEAYTPMLVSIGPYHRGNPKLSAMEKHKLRYLKSFLETTEENSVEPCILEMKELAEKARKCYAEPTKLDDDEFAEMLLLDGCFIIEFVRESCQVGERNKDDPIFNMEWMKYQICIDMMLLENQLPYFVLSKLYDMSKEENYPFTIMAMWVLYSRLPKVCPISISRFLDDAHEIKHLLHLVQSLCCPPSEQTISEGNNTSQNGILDKMCAMVQIPCCRPSEQTISEGNNTGDVQTISEGNNTGDVQTNSEGNNTGDVQTNSEGNNTSQNIIVQRMCTVVELQEAGVEFKKVGNVYTGVPISDLNSVSDDVSLFDIKFTDGLMEIPCLIVEDSTETIFRNLIACEQYFSNVPDCKYFSDYAIFMDQLINTEKDVNLLRRKGIIVNWLGTDKEVADIFNKLCEGVFQSSSFYYEAVCKDVNKHCAQWFNVLMTKLRHDYFNNPWRSLATVAAILIVIFTVTQTIGSLISLF